MSGASHGDAHGSSEKKININGLIMIGFVGLIVAGMLLAVYAARYVPETLSRLAGAVYLTGEAPKNATSTPREKDKTTSSPAPAITPEVPSTPSVSATSTTRTPRVADDTGYTPRTTTYTPPRVIQNTPRLSGYPDLALTNLRGGYFSGNRFIEDSRISSNDDMGIKFTVWNQGTNIVDGWRVRVRVEGQDDAIALGGLLYPNGYQNFTLRATDLENGALTTRVDVDYTNTVIESNERNNSDSVEVVVGSTGSGSSRDVSCTLDASDTRVSDGDRITLEWDTRGNPNYASINQGIGRVDEDGGSERVRVTDDTTYRMTVRNSRGDEDTCSVTVRVD